MSPMWLFYHWELLKKNRCPQPRIALKFRCPRCDLWLEFAIISTPVRIQTPNGWNKNRCTESRLETVEYRCPRSIVGVPDRSPVGLYTKINCPGIAWCKLIGLKLDVPDESAADVRDGICLESRVLIWSPPMNLFPTADLISPNEFISPADLISPDEFISSSWFDLPKRIPLPPTDFIWEVIWKMRG